MRSAIVDVAALLDNDPGATARNEAAKNRLENFRIAYLNSTPRDNFDHALWQSVKIESAKVDSAVKLGSAIYSLTAPANYCNFTHNMMGGAIATILDGLTNCTIALISRKGAWEHSGVSRSTSVTYLRPIATDMKLAVECTILRANDWSITIQGVMKRADNGKELAISMQEFVAITRSKL